MDLQHAAIERATLADADEIFEMYRSLIDDPFGTWNEEYPSRALVEEDLTQSIVYVLRAMDGRILAAIVEEQSDEFDSLAPWYQDVTSWVQLGRLGVAHEAQGNGIARKMLAHAMEQAKARGVQGVRFLVGAHNLPAQRSYAHLGFEVCGETHAWDEHWLCYEKRL